MEESLDYATESAVVPPTIMSYVILIVILICLGVGIWKLKQKKIGWAVTLFLVALPCTAFRVYGLTITWYPTFWELIPNLFLAIIDSLVTVVLFLVTLFYLVKSLNYYSFFNKVWK